MNQWVRGCRGIYRRVARAFPRDFRMVCGDGLERLGDDIAPLVWREYGVLGLMRLMADLALHLPMEYGATSIARLKELTMAGDVFEGTWKANIEKSKWDGAYTPEQACVRFEATSTGYLLVAYGIKDGKAVAERPTSIVADGTRRPMVDLNGRPIPGVPPGATVFGHQPDAQTLEHKVELDGKVLGGGTFRVSDDGNTLTATTEGMGAKGPYKVVAVFERVVPDPYVPQS